MSEYTIRPGHSPGMVSIRVGVVTLMDVPWRVALDLSGRISHAALNAAREVGESDGDVLELAWLSTFGHFAYTPLDRDE